jgi:hypothetical protein
MTVKYFMSIALSTSARATNFLLNDFVKASSDDVVAILPKLPVAYPGARLLGREPINSEWWADVRFGAHVGLKSDITALPKSANSRLTHLRTPAQNYSHCSRLTSWW